jgi:hypothetical protein
MNLTVSVCHGAAFVWSIAVQNATCGIFSSSTASSMKTMVRFYLTEIEKRQEKGSCKSVPYPAVGVAVKVESAKEVQVGESHNGRRIRKRRHQCKTCLIWKLAQFTWRPTLGSYSGSRIMHGDREGKSGRPRVKLQFPPGY